MQSPKKGFQLQTDSHTILTTFQPSHIDFTVTNRSTGAVRKGHFYDSTLPASVKEQCQAVSDLYDFLEGKQPSEMQVDENSLKFKVVRIKKERWYSLAIQEQAQREPLKSEHRQERIPQKMEEQVNNIGLLSERNEELYRHNEQLRREVERLNTINAQLQNKLQNNELLALYHGELKQIDQAMELEQPQENKEEDFPIQQYHPIQPLPTIQKHTLVVPGQQNPNYKLQSDIITKETDQASVLCFQQCIQECIQKGQSLNLSIQVLSLANDWIIFGILPKELQNNPLCYINKDVFAYSGSMNFVINDFNTIDLDRRHQLTEGGTISLKLEFIKKTVRWLVDGKQAYAHPLSDKILQKQFYPFLMLSQPGDSVRLNCQE